MDKLYRAGVDDSFLLFVGDVFYLETQRVPVVPPFLMIMPYIVIESDAVKVLGQEAFPGEGVHGCTYRLCAESEGTGAIEVGFKDLRTFAITHSSRASFTIRPSLSRGS